MNNDKLIYKARPNYLILVILFVTVIFCYRVTVSVSNSPWQLPGFADATVRLIAIAFMLFFTMLAGACTYALSRFRTYKLYPQGLMIKQPLLFKEQSVALTEITAIAEERPGAAGIGAISSTNIYTGSVSTLVLNNAEQLKISGLEVWDRKNLIAAIRLQLAEIKRTEMLSKS